MSDWNETIQKSLADHPRITEHLRQSELAEERFAAIIPMAPGERPTESGWYVVQHPNTDRDIVNLIERRGVLEWYQTENEMPFDLDEGLSSGVIFIARIYPDRIDGREG